MIGRLARAANSESRISDEARRESATHQVQHFDLGSSSPQSLSWKTKFPDGWSLVRTRSSRVQANSTRAACNSVAALVPVPDATGVDK